jgi:hypothetical protein
MKAICHLSCLLFLSLLFVLLSSSALPDLIGNNRASHPADGPGNPAVEQARIVNFARRLHFEPNVGQTDASVHFISRDNNYTLFLTQWEAIVSVKNKIAGKPMRESYDMVCMQLAGANPDPEITGYDILPGKTNYYLGNNPDEWHTSVDQYASVKYHDIYSNIDLIYYGNEGLLEYDFVIMPGGDPKDIRMNFISDEKIRFDEQGNLVFNEQDNSLVLKKPVAYQETSEGRKMVEAAFTLGRNNRVKFIVGNYDRKYPLIIDPVLIFTSYLGGSGLDIGAGIAVDESGNIYVAGSTSSVDFPMRSNFQDKYPNSYSDVFVTKFNAEGTDIVYSTYIGGSCYDEADAIAVDKNGQVSITGRTCSGDDAGTPEYEGYPVLNACQPNDGGDYDAFVTVLNSSGELAYSTYLGGKYEDYATDIAIDDEGDVYVTGTVFSYDFPVKNAFMENIPSYYFATFITKIDPANAGDESLVYSTFLGGEYDDYSSSIAVDRYGCAYVTGNATLGFPVTANAIQKEYQGKGDIYVTKLSADGSSLVYSTFLGDSLSNSGRDIVVDDSCCAYVSGSGLKATPGALNNPGTSFLCKLNPSGDGFVYIASVFIDNLALDTSGNVFGTFYSTVKGGMVFAVNREGSDTLFRYDLPILPSDLAADPDSNLYIVGTTDIDGLATEDAYQTNLAGGRDALVTKIHIEPPEMLVIKVLSDPLYDIPVPVTNTPCDI